MNDFDRIRTLCRSLTRYQKAAGERQHYSDIRDRPAWSAYDAACEQYATLHAELGTLAARHLPDAFRRCTRLRNLASDASSKPHLSPTFDWPAYAAELDDLMAEATVGLERPPEAQGEPAGLRQTDAARTAGVNRATIGRAVKAGKIKLLPDRRVDAGSFYAWLSTRDAQPDREETDAEVERKFRDADR